jgi:molybdopterin-guanine dinucleotide biosynthesis protein A
VSKRSPIGAVLAGGRATRLGGDKARIELAGRPLLAWPLAALAAVLEEVAVVAKEDTPLPDFEALARACAPGARATSYELWIEPDPAFHPRAGLVHALERAGGRAVLVCAGDMPLVTPQLVRELAAAPAAGAPAVVPRAAGRVQPLLARYEPPALAGLRAAPPDAALTEAVLALEPRLLDLPDARPFLNVNTPEDLATAAQFLSRRS